MIVLDNNLHYLPGMGKKSEKSKNVENHINNLKNVSSLESGFEE